MIRLLILTLTCLSLVACSPSGDDLTAPPVPLGDFRLGHNIAVAPKVKKGPFSRDFTEAQITAAMQQAVADRFGRYEGAGLYHIAVSIEGLVLAQPGIPVVGSPKSAMIIRLTIWDDAAGRKLNDPPEQMTVFESASRDTFLGSGLTRSADEQLTALSVNAAKQFELFVAERHALDGWFVPDAES